VPRDFDARGLFVANLGQDCVQLALERLLLAVLDLNLTSTTLGLSVTRVLSGTPISFGRVTFRRRYRPVRPGRQGFDVASTVDA
jgi:hypothetical protein